MKINSKHEDFKSSGDSPKTETPYLPKVSSRLDILQKTFPQIITTMEVREEFGSNFPEWISVCPVQDKSKVLKFESIVDRGEASAIVLALETQDCVLIIEEKKGRKLASELIIELEKVDFRFSDIIVREILKLSGE